MLSESMNAADEIVFDLNCDGCGVTYAAGPGLRASAADLWMSAYWQGWRLGRGQGRELGHTCPACRAESG